MLNQTVLVGRLVKEPKIESMESGQRVCYITLAVPRSWKNANGEYETDFIPCVTFNNIADSTKEYCKKGDLLGIKGRIKSNGNILEVIAEKISFLKQGGRNE